MFKQTLIAALLAFGLAGAANAQEQAAVQMPDPEIVQRVPAPVPPFTDSGDFDAFGTPIPAPESTLADAGGSGHADAGESEDYWPLPADSAEVP